MSRPISFRAKIACVQAALHLPKFIPCTVLHLAVEANYNPNHFWHVVTCLEKDGIFERVGPGGRGGFEFRLNEERCKEVYGEYLDLGEAV